MQPLGDSGIYLRGIPQVQIWDPTEEKKFKLGADKGSGGLWNNKRNEGKYPLARMDRPFGEWNHFRIKMIGERVTVELNGEIVVQNAVMDNFFAHRTKKNTDATSKPVGLLVSPVPPRGPIQLQTHGSEIRWRNIYIREIPAGEADDVLRAQNDSGFVELINGKDLSDWQEVPKMTVTRSVKETLCARPARVETYSPRSPLATRLLGSSSNFRQQATMELHYEFQKVVTVPMTAWKFR